MTLRLASHGTVASQLLSEDAAAATVMDEPAFQLFYLHTAARLRAYVARVLGDDGEADDIVQESYLRLLRSAPATDDPQQLWALLFRIAHNQMIDYWRRRRRQRDASSDEPVTGAGDPPDHPLRLDMARVFNQLRPRQRQLLWLAYVEGATHREIASATGLRELSVRVLLARARRKLATLVRQGGRT